MIQDVLPFKRIYCDIPNEIHAIMQRRSKESGLSNKNYLAKLIQEDAQKAGKSRKSK